MEMVVLALVGIVVLGPDRLPQFARDAARMLRSLRDLATGARQQLREELGPEFADIDLRTLNPRTAVQRAVFGDDMPDFRKYSPTNIVRDAIYGDDDDDDRDPEVDDDLTSRPVSMTKPGGSAGGSAGPAGPKPAPAAARSRSTSGRPSGSASGSSGSPSTNGARPRPRPRPRTAYDDDAT
jgi:sec-independent protein translocase protein TatB